METSSVNNNSTMQPFASGAKPTSSSVKKTNQAVQEQFKCKNCNANLPAGHAKQHFFWCITNEQLQQLIEIANRGQSAAPQTSSTQPKPIPGIDYDLSPPVVPLSTSPAESV